jgi:large subunit ribosomal protein L13
MLPKNTISRKMMTRVKVYRGSEHPHTAQKPVVAAF